MAGLKELIKHIDGETRLAPMGGMWYGTIVAPLPATLVDKMFVSIPDIDPSVKFGPCRWPTSSVPALGAEVLVAFDNRENIWVLSIW